MNSSAKNGKKIQAHFQARGSVKTPYPRWSVDMMGSMQEPDQPNYSVNLTKYFLCPAMSG